MNRNDWRLFLLCALIVPVACTAGGTSEGTAKKGGAGADGGAADVATSTDAAAQDTAKVTPDTAKRTPDTAKEIDTAVANQPPVANDDQATTAGGKPVEITVLYNDSNPDGDKLKIEKNTQGQKGTVVAIYGGTVLQYTPVDAAFIGVDSFEYTVTDGKGGTDTATVAVSSKGLPTLKIVSPKKNDIIEGKTVEVVFEVTGCVFTHPGNDKNGCHAHTYLDGKGWVKVGKKGIGHYVTAPVAVTPLTAGTYNFGLQLTVNDGSDSAWQPTIADSVTFQYK